MQRNVVWDCWNSTWKENAAVRLLDGFGGCESMTTRAGV
jgi:hypothetical protein